MRATRPRYSMRQVSVAIILVLAGVVLFRGTRSLNGGLASSASAPSTSLAGMTCEWREGGPELFVVDHQRKHSQAEHWFHVAESFTGRRAALKEVLPTVNATVYVQVLDPVWMARLSPMTRLLIVSSLVAVGAGGDVHLVDANRASFSYTSSGSSHTGSGSVRGIVAPLGGQPGTLPADARSGRTANAKAARQAVAGPWHDRSGGDGAGAGSQRGLGPGTRAAEDASAAAAAAGGGGGGGNFQLRLLPGQVGLLEFDPRGRGSEVVLSPHLPRPERPLASSSPEVFAASSQAGAVAAAEEGDEEEEGRGGARHGAAFRGRNMGEDTPRAHGGAVCVKYLQTVGRKTEKRKNWFPTTEDAQSLRGAIDTFCPLAFVRAEGEGGGEEEGRLQPRRLLLYQRDRNRKILQPKELMEDLRRRLGSDWIVEEMVHNDDRHPCEIAQVVSSVDVLLTAHGFQSMLGLFMRPGSLLFEVFPRKYLKSGYAQMAEGLGLRHGFSMSPSLKPLMGFSHPTTETCMKWYLCRYYARNSDVVLDEAGMDRLVELALPPT